MNVGRYVVVLSLFFTFTSILNVYAAPPRSSVEKGSKSAFQQCKTECQDSHLYCTSHPKQCGHGSGICTHQQLTVACNEKYGANCVVSCEERYPSEVITAPVNSCLADCQSSFDQCSREGYKISACDRKYGDSCKQACQ